MRVLALETDAGQEATRAAGRRQAAVLRGAPYEPEAVPAVEASFCELARDDRRLHPRFAFEELRGLRAVRIPLGPLVSLVDMSAGGALIESDQPLRPGAEARLELADARGVRTVPFRVVRGWVSSLEGARRFRGACMFAEPLDLSGLVLPEPAVQTP
jgi:PilZ domain